MSINTTYEKFAYIYPPKYAHKPEDVMESKYTRETIKEKFTVRLDSPTVHEFRVYASYDAFNAHCATMVEHDKCFHEVIFTQNQKLKFDIDISTEKLDAFNAPPVDIQTELDADLEILLAAFMENERDIKYRDIIHTIIGAILDAFYITYGMDLESRHKILCESHSVTNGIYSNHFIIGGYYVTNAIQSAAFTDRVKLLLPVDYWQFLDVGINKPTQNFRLVGNYKHHIIDNQTLWRCKRLVSAGLSEDTLITNIIGCEPLPDIVHVDAAPTYSGKIAASTNAADQALVLTICETAGMMHHNVFSGYHVNCANRGIYLFKRISAEFCTFCQREHTQDSSFFVSVGESSDVSAPVFKYCRKYLKENGKNGSHFEIIGEIIPEGADLPMAVVDKSKFAGFCDKRAYLCAQGINNMRLDSSFSKSGSTQSNLFHTLPAANKHIYNEPALRPFELVSTLIVHAPMKIGKTKALADYISTHFSSALRAPKIRFVSFRQTFSNNIKERFSDFVLYSDVVGMIRSPKVIIQVESIWRLELDNEPPDLLILDECESIFEQFNSGLMRSKYTECIAKFQYLLAYSKHVVCMDAYISNRTYKIVEAMRGLATKKDKKDNTNTQDTTSNTIIYHQNTHKNATDDHYYFTSNKIKWLGVLHASLLANECVVVPISSLAEAKALYHLLTRKYPSKNIKIYSSETSITEKKLHFSDVNKYWSEYDVLIYTPTISAGVSFEVAHYTKIFGYFTNQSCPVETCIQMMGRIRDVEHHEFYIYLTATCNNLPETAEDITRILFQSRNAMDVLPPINIEINAHGETIYHHGAYFEVYLQNIIAANRSKNSFIKWFMTLVASSGANVEWLSDATFETLTGESLYVDDESKQLNPELANLVTEVKNEKSQQQSVEIAALVASDDITSPVAAQIMSDIQSQSVDVPATQKIALERYRLRQTYNWVGPITDKFVSTYNNKSQKLIYKNLSVMAAAETIDKSLEKIREHELQLREYYMSTGFDNIINHSLSPPRNHATKYKDYQHYGRHNDLNRKYMYSVHLNTIMMLRELGWKDYLDERVQHRLVIESQINYVELWRFIRILCDELEIKIPRVSNSFVVVVKIANVILQQVYGVTVYAGKNEPNLFQLKQSTLFARTAEEHTRLKIPQIGAPPLAPNANTVVAPTVNVVGFDYDGDIDMLANI